MKAIDLERMVAARIRARRLALGLTQKALADKLGTQYPYINALEHGRRSPTLTTIAKLSEALEVSPDYWFATTAEKISA